MCNHYKMSPLIISFNQKFVFKLNLIFIFTDTKQTKFKS
jgi:superfamily I DNA and/or RNA helicase